MATTRTRRDLVDAALANLGILAAGQTADAEDFEAVDDHVEPLLAWLENAEILDLDNVDEIPLEFFSPLSVLLADDAALEFGLTGIPGGQTQPAVAGVPTPVQKAIDDIRLVTYARPTYERLKVEYF